MIEVQETPAKKTDKAYRSLSKNEGDYVIDFDDLFGAIEKDEVAKKQVAKIFTSTPPLQFN